MSGFDTLSVTTIISEGLPKPALIGWAAKVTAECAVDNHKVVAAMLEGGDSAGALDYLKRARWRSSGAKADIGTIVHAAVESHLQGKPLADSDLEDLLREKRVPLENWRATRGYIAAAFAFLQERNPVVHHTEGRVFSKTHGYSGTADILAMMEIDGDEVPVVCDFKTSKAIYPEVGLQLVAYSRADGVGEGGKRVQRGGLRYYHWTDDTAVHPLFPVDEPCRNGIAVRVSPSGSYEAVRFNLSDDLFDVFLAVKGVAEGKPVMTDAMGFAL